MNHLGIVLHGMLATSTFAQLCAGWIAVLPLAGMAIYGWVHGAFLAVIAGLQILASGVLAMVCGPVVAEVLVLFGLSASASMAAAYFIVFFAGVTLIRIAVGALVPEGAVRFAPLTDHLVGAVVGGVAGALVSGAILVGWSMAPMPGWLRLDSSQLPIDPGPKLLWCFSRWSEADPKAARRLFAGDPPATDTAASPGIVASEPFVDLNGNGRYDGGDADDPAAAGGVATITPERFLDLDGDGRFTPALRFATAGGDGRRAIGLLDCYRLAEWRRIKSMHAPRIVSNDAAEIKEDHVLEEPIYRTEATDADGPDGLTFAVRPVDDQEPPEVTIDATSGAVTLLAGADYETKKRLQFVIEARDKTGLSDTKTVSIRVRDVIE